MDSGSSARCVIRQVLLLVCWEGDLLLPLLSDLNKSKPEAAGGLNEDGDYWLPRFWVIVADSDLPKGIAGSARSPQAGGVTSSGLATASQLCLCSCPRHSNQLAGWPSLKGIQEHCSDSLLTVRLKV